MDEITQARAIVACRALVVFAAEVERYVADGEVRALGWALEGFERALAELKAYQRQPAHAGSGSNHGRYQ